MCLRYWVYSAGAQLPVHVGRGVVRLVLVPIGGVWMGFRGWRSTFTSNNIIYASILVDLPSPGPNT